MLANDGSCAGPASWSASWLPATTLLAARAHYRRRAPDRSRARTGADRLDLWLKSQIEKLLAPLFSLTAADDITGMARGIAFQLVEALGVLERQKVAEEVKGLDQPSRATLRKYGVRFGAYHIYLPILLKPAPRALAAQLWALKHESPDAKASPTIAASGGVGPHLDPDRQGNAEGALPHRRLSRLRRARGARRHSRAAGRSHPSGAVVARQARRRRSRMALSMAAALS